MIFFFPFICLVLTVFSGIYSLPSDVQKKDHSHIFTAGDMEVLLKQ